MWLFANSRHRWGRWKNVKNQYKMPKISTKLSQNIRKALELSSKSKCVGFTFKILLLVSKPNGHKVPRCYNILQLCSNIKLV